MLTTALLLAALGLAGHGPVAQAQQATVGGVAAVAEACEPPDCAGPICAAAP